MRRKVLAILVMAGWILGTLWGAPPAVRAATLSVGVQAGSAQSAPVGTAFATALQVLVTDAGTVSPGVSVTFSAPASGATGTFAGGVQSVTASTDAGGVATAPAFTAGGTAGTYDVTATVAGATPVQFTLTNDPGAPAQLVFTVSPSSATAGEAFPAAPSVVVEDVYGNTVTTDAAQISLSITPHTGAAGAVLDGGTSVAAAGGVASFGGLSIGKAGTGYTLTASDATDGLAATSGPFGVVAGAPADLTVSASAYSVSPGGSTTISGSLADAYGNAVAGATVYLAATAGSLAQVQAATGANGRWGVVGLTLPYTAGTDTVTASVYSAVYGTISKSLSVTVNPGVPYRVTITASPATVAAGGTTALSGAVEDAYGNGVPGVAVDLSATGGILSRSVLTTGGSGQWSGADLQVPTSPGTVTVTATVYGSITKSLPVTVATGTPYKITLDAASTTVVAGGSTLLSLAVTDAYGNGVPGATVDFATTGGTLAEPEVSTGLAGQASNIGFTVPLTTGTVTVTATVYGTAVSQSLSVTVASGAPSQLTLSATPASVSAGGSVTLSGAVTDVEGNGVGDVSVDLSTTAGSLSKSQVMTGTGGQWSAALTVPTATDTVTVTATVAGTALTQTLPVTVTPGAPFDITVTPVATSVPAGGSTTLSLDVTDSFGNGVGGATVDLVAVGATLAQAQVTTGSNGQASGIGVTMPTAAGTVAVTATVAGTAVSQTVTLTARALSPSQVMVNASPASVAAGGSTQLSGMVTDANGNAVSGASLDLSATAGSLSVTQVVTGGNGEWSGVTLTAPTAAGPDTVTATVSGTTISQSLDVTVTAGPPARIAIQASPSSIAAGGSATLSGTVTDAGGNGVGNATVDLSTTAGSLSQTQATTGSGGQWSGQTLTVTGVPGQASTATVTATVAGTAISRTATVTVAAAPVPPDGIGTLTVSPASMPAGAANQSLGFTYTAPDDISGGELAIALPPGWSATAVTAGAGTASLNGGAVQVSGLTLASGTPLTLGLTGVTAGTATGVASFAAQEASSSAGTLTPLAASPSLTVTAPSQGGQQPGAGAAGGQSGTYTVTVDVSPVSVAAGGIAQVTGTVSDAYGPVSGATVALNLSRGDEALGDGSVSLANLTTDASGAFDAILTAPSTSGAVTLTAQLTSPAAATVSGSVYGAGQAEAQAVEIVTPQGTKVSGAVEEPATGACGAVNATSGATSETGCGTGTFAVAQYNGNPTGVTPPAGAGAYFDAAVSTANQFTSVTIKECNVQSGESLDWWDPQSAGGAGGWEAVFQPASYSSGCLSFVANGSSSPSLDDLFGTVFTVVSAPFIGGGGGGATPAPGVELISPASGTAGTTVTVTGFGFLYATAVDFGPNPAKRYVVDSDSQLTAVAPPGTGTVDVTVSNSARTSATSSADQFTYGSAAPPAPAAAAAAPPVQACVPRSFPDVPTHFWAWQAIETLSCKGIASGFPDGMFRPDQPVTRAQFVKMLVLALGLQPATGVQRFSDVPAGAWYAPYVSTAVSAGIVQGTSPTTFSPGATVTREQMAVMLARALKLTTAAPLTFTDLAQISPWAMVGVAEAVAAGYLNGFPNGSFQPLGPTTRAQAAKVLALVVLRRGG